MSVLLNMSYSYHQLHICSVWISGLLGSWICLKYWGLWGLRNCWTPVHVGSELVLDIYFTKIHVEPIPIYCRYNSQIYIQSQSQYIVVIFQDVKNLPKQLGQSKRPPDDDKSKNSNWQSRAENFDLNWMWCWKLVHICEFPFSTSLLWDELQCTVSECYVLQVVSCNTMYQNYQDPSLPSRSDILRYIRTCRASAIYDIPINWRYTHKKCIQT